MGCDQVYGNLVFVCLDVAPVAGLLNEHRLQRFASGILCVHDAAVAVATLARQVYRLRLQRMSLGWNYTPPNVWLVTAIWWEAMVQCFIRGPRDV